MINQEVLNALVSRRSIRKYKKEQITEEELNAVLEAGQYAPTAMGRQTPIIVAVQNPEMVAKLSKMNAAVMGRDGDPFYGAPTVLIVFSKNDTYTGIQDGTCVMTNLLNGAYAAGLGSCWIHRAHEVFETQEGKALKVKWNIPEDYVGIGNVILGYVDGQLPQPKERKANYIVRD